MQPVDLGANVCDILPSQSGAFYHILWSPGAFPPVQAQSGPESLSGCPRAVPICPRQRPGCLPRRQPLGSEPRTGPSNPSPLILSALNASPPNVEKQPPEPCPGVVLKVHVMHHGQGLKHSWRYRSFPRKCDLYEWTIATHTYTTDYIIA